MGQSYEQSKKTATKIIVILGIITIAEVIFALLGKGAIHSPLVKFRLRKKFRSCVAFSRLE